MEAGGTLGVTDDVQGWVALMEAEEGGGGGLAQAKTAQGSYSTGIHGDGRRSFLKTRWDQAQFSESRS